MVAAGPGGRPQRHRQGKGMRQEQGRSSVVLDPRTHGPAIRLPDVDLDDGEEGRTGAQPGHLLRRLLAAGMVDEDGSPTELAATQLLTGKPYISHVLEEALNACTRCSGCDCPLSRCCSIITHIPCIRF
jgi:hypothetical protein